MFTGDVSHVISSHVPKDCGAHKPTYPECSHFLYLGFPSLVLALHATIGQFVQSLICVLYIATKPLPLAGAVQVYYREPVLDSGPCSLTHYCLRVQGNFPQPIIPSVFWPSSKTCCFTHMEPQSSLCSCCRTALLRARVLSIITNAKPGHPAQDTLAGAYTSTNITTVEPLYQHPLYQHNPSISIDRSGPFLGLW